MMALLAANRASRLIECGELEHQLGRLHPVSSDPLAGLFGPHSLIWRVDRESAVFLGAGRALLLQLAHPWVAASIAEHSHVLSNPIDRFHRTFRIAFAMVFGTLDQARTAARHLHCRHASITGALSESVGPFPIGSRYQANDVEALRWVHATLVDTAICARDLVLPPLTAEELAQYYAESRLFGALFGIAPELLPQDWPSFVAYNEMMWCSDVLTVGPAAQAIAHELLTGSRTRPRVPQWYLALTTQMLPSRLRDAFGLRYGEAERHTATRAVAWLRRTYRWLPGRLRYVGPYHEAMGRLAGRARPALATRLLNRLWIGQESMAGGRLKRPSK